jgi:hypothetical protein
MSGYLYRVMGNVIYTPHNIAAKSSLSPLLSLGNIRSATTYRDRKSSRETSTKEINPRLIFVCIETNLNTITIF